MRDVELEWCPECRGIYLDKGERERLVGLAAGPRPRNAVAAPQSVVTRGTGLSSGIADVGVTLAGCLLDLVVEIID